MLPFIIFFVVNIIIRLKAVLNIAFCPKFSIAKLVFVFNEAASYFFND